MTSSVIFRVYLLGLMCVGGVFGATLAGYDSSIKPDGKEGHTPEQILLPPLASTQNHTAHPRTQLPSVPSSLTGQEAPRGLERYIAGLGRLSAVLRDPEYDWEAVGVHVTPTTSHEGSTSTTLHEGRYGNIDFRHDVQKLFALAGSMKRLSNDMKQLLSNDGDKEMQEDPTPADEAETNLPSRLHTALTVAVANLSRLSEYYFWHESGVDENINEEEGTAVKKEDGMQVLIQTLEALARAHTNYTAAVNSVNTFTGRIIQYSTAEVPAVYTASVRSASTLTSRIVESFTSEAPKVSTQAMLDWHENQRGFLQIAKQLKALLGFELAESDRTDTALVAQPSTIPSTSTTSTTTTTSFREPREQPCLPPFQLIAYRMCILQEMQLKLSWSDAQEFCRERGAELAEDMVVIKTRRFLNDLYGEDSTRTRWPVWVGGRRADRTWIWEGGQQVPEFLWAPSEPRVFSNYLAPEGQCMMLDGYRRFYGASLPCHLRRRFVCQLDN